MSNTLKGTIMNPTVVRGKSAYEIAVENGFEGNEQEWLESLVGGALTTDQVTFSEDIRTNQDVGSVKGSAGGATLAEKGQTLTDWIKKVFGEVETEGGTEAQNFTVYCGSLSQADGLSASAISVLGKYDGKKPFSAKFEAGYDRFVVAFPTKSGSRIKVYDDSCFDGDASDDFYLYSSTIYVDKLLSHHVFCMDVPEPLSSCFDFTIEIVQ